MKHISILGIALLTACSPIQRSSTLLGLGVATCGGGKAATAAGESWGAILSAAGCWLSDWAADRLDAQRDALRRTQREQAESVAVDPRLEQINAAAVELAAAHAEMLADPCEENAEVLEQALTRCRALAR